VLTSDLRPLTSRGGLSPTRRSTRSRAARWRSAVGGVGHWAWEHWACRWGRRV